jgi:[acyl-carrier-protein] S-malonyltransferase
MREAANRVVEPRSAYEWRAPSIPVVQNVDGSGPRGDAAIRDALARQLYLPVRWTTCVATLASNGATRIAECGPGKVLSGLVKRIDKSLEGRALGTPPEFDTALSDWR